METESEIPENKVDKALILVIYFRDSECKTFIPVKTA